LRQVTLGIDVVPAAGAGQARQNCRRLTIALVAEHNRKNWLFAGHDESAQNHAVLWSLIASAPRHEIDVQFYLRSVLAYLPELPPEQLQNYLPDVWKHDLTAEQQAALNAHHAALAQATAAGPSG